MQLLVIVIVAAQVVVAIIISIIIIPCLSCSFSKSKHAQEDRDLSVVSCVFHPVAPSDSDFGIIIDIIVVSVAVSSGFVEKLAPYLPHVAAAERVPFAKPFDSLHDALHHARQERVADVFRVSVSETQGACHA